MATSVVHKSWKAWMDPGSDPREAEFFASRLIVINRLWTFNGHDHDKYYDFLVMCDEEERRKRITKLKFSTLFFFQHS